MAEMMSSMEISEVLRTINCVVFDVGETLVDETALWTTQAKAAGVTPFALMGVLGALIERGEDHRQVWSILGVDAPPPAPPIKADDLYPDALECVRAVRDAGLQVGIAGNQPAGVHAQLRSAGFDPDFIASSAVWGVAKPSSDFFARIVGTCASDPEQILYVGDRLDNDILPARAAGMRTALVRRGPWGYVHAQHADAELADLRIDSLDEFTRSMVTLV